MQWLDWATDAGLEPKVIEFISTFPEYLHRFNEDNIRATPRSYERISKTYKVYREQKDSISRTVFLNVIKGNVGKMIAEEFINFVESDYNPLVSFEDVFQGTSITEAVVERIRTETHTRLYLSAKNILKTLEAFVKSNQEVADSKVERLIELLHIYPIDLRVGIMKDIRNSFPEVYQYASQKEDFIELYFDAYQ